MTALKTALILAYAGLLALPVYVFFKPRLSSFSGLDTQNLAGLLFPLFGLIAFSLISLQILIGPNIRWLKRIFPRIYNFHRLEGLFAFLLAVTHPLLLMVAVGPLEAFWRRSVVSEELKGFILFGEAALLIMAVTVTTAFAAWKLSSFQRSWRTIHYANYAVFILAWVHSWFIGSDVRTTPLKYIWLFYLFAGVGSLLIRVFSPQTIGRQPVKNVPQAD